MERDLAPPAQVDEDRAALQELDAQVAEFEAQLRVAELPGPRRRAWPPPARRSEAAEAEADRARSALDDRRATAPAPGRVERVFFDPGEVATAGTPVVSILPPGDRTAIFFVPEPRRASLSSGDRLGLSCDGCPDGLAATVTRLASDPQYTPPLIYSREERQRLVYRAEARCRERPAARPARDAARP